MFFFVKINGERHPARWYRTAESLHHASADGRRALCGSPTPLMTGEDPRRRGIDLSNDLLTCLECAGQVFRAKKQA